MINTVFFGNGLNRLNDHNLSWGGLMSKISTISFPEGIDNTFQYEMAVLKKAYKNVKTPCRKYETSERAVKEDIKEEVGKFLRPNIYDSLEALPADHFITTNYDTIFLKDVRPYRFIPNRKRELIYSIQRGYEINCDAKTRFFWPFHGCMESPQSIMLGFNQYGNYLGRIKEYISGNWKDKNGKLVSPMETRLNNKSKDIISWIDLFFMSNMHIIGFGFPFSEIDIWWILNKRRRIQWKNKSLIRNKIYYYPVESEPEKLKQTLTAFGVEIEELTDYTRGFENNYIEQINKISSKI